MDAVDEARWMCGHQFSKCIDVTTNGVSSTGPTGVGGEDETRMASPLRLPRSSNDSKVADIVGEQAALLTSAENEQRFVFLRFPTDLSGSNDVETAFATPANRRRWSVPLSLYFSFVPRAKWPAEELSARASGTARSIPRCPLPLPAVGTPALHRPKALCAAARRQTKSHIEAERRGTGDEELGDALASKGALRLSTAVVVLSPDGRCRRCGSRRVWQYARRLRCGGHG
jgi:hypothetical protein